MAGISLPDAPALNLSNPAVGAASGFAQAASHAYAAGLQFATALRNSAAQMQQRKAQEAHQQQQDTQKAQNEYAIETQKYRQAGAVPAPQFNSAPVNGMTNAGGVERPTLKMGPQPADQLDPSLKPDDPNHIQIDSRGQAWHYPSLKESTADKQKPLDDTNSFILPPEHPLATQLEKLGVPRGTRLPLSEALKAAQPEEQDIVTDKFSVPVRIGKKTGTMQPIEMPAGVTKKDSDKPDVQQFIPGYVGAGGGPIIYNKNSQTAEEVAVPKGAKREMSPAQQAAADARDAAAAERADRRGEAAQTRKDAQATAAEAKGQAAITKLQTQEQEQHNRRKQLGLALSAANGEMVIDPTNDKGKEEVELTPARRAFFQNEYNRATSLAQNYHDAQQKIIKASGGTPAQPLTPDAAPAPAATPATPPSPPAPKTKQVVQTPAVAPQVTKPTAPAAPAPKPVAAAPVPAPAPKPVAPAPAATPAPKPLEPWNRLAKPTTPAAPAPAAAAPAAPATAKPKYTDQQILVNPKTGAKVKYSAKDNKWLPM